MTKISLIPCDFCGNFTDAAYPMTYAGGLWLERTDGSPAQPTDLYCCYDCCDALEKR